MDIIRNLSFIVTGDLSFMIVTGHNISKIQLILVGTTIRLTKGCRQTKGTVTVRVEKRYW